MTSLLSLAILVVIIVGLWKVFTKAGQPGWGSLIPIYNAYLWLKIAGKPGWWLLLLFIPLVNIVIAIIVAIEVAKRFGKSAAFGIFLVAILAFIGIPILGFGDAVYTPQGAAPSPAPAA
jgi:Na+/proline symporter